MNERHPYFAYGSNLCPRQMTGRCPGAVRPRPATLPDHGWLINERGVATIAPRANAMVHGVLWWITDDDLAVLDRAEGCRCGTGATASWCSSTTARPRRGCTSTTGSGPARRDRGIWNG